MILILNGCTAKSQWQLLNKSMKAVVSKKSNFSAYSKYVLESRKDAFKTLKVPLDSLQFDKISIIEEYNPLLSHMILTEICFYGKHSSIKYLKKNENEIAKSTDEKVTGREEIIYYLDKNDLDGLIEMAKNKGRSISDGSWIFISHYYKSKPTKSIIIPQFSIK